MDQQLLAFLKVAEMQNFTRAAEALHTTQPAISQHVQNLERHLGAKLLERSNKYVRLNQAGEIAYHHAKEILSLYAHMERLVADLVSEATGVLRIGASFTFGEYVLPHAIAKFRTLYPAVTPTISISNTREVVHQVASGDLDVGVIEGHYHEHQAKIEPFATDTVHIVVSANHPLSKRTNLNISDFLGETWIVRESGSGTRDFVDQLFQHLSFHPTGLMEFGSTQLIKEAVEAGLGISILSQWAIRKELALGTLQTLSISNEPLHRDFSIVVGTSDFQTKATRLFCELIKHASKEWFPIL